MTESLVRGFIFSFQTKKMGRIPNAQSVRADMAACAYVTFARVLPLRQWPEPLLYCVQM